MSDHEGNRKMYLAREIQEGLETVDSCPRPTESQAVSVNYLFSVLIQASFMGLFIVC